mmetsp:Transcript_93132/g.267948  ORF Transcript_93132/g.267948 Transcript_93132/m.267948 type:complete len:510 (-) Transcript_93132:143-1672(-)|eukprot:CAMPEP_0170235390 /NCGR_PEP_ID=MMETSP0116_2-20130129/17441_1 /TAXON_ID=400756 /ORGANISM="Durinskia baltica, Strain CSIRO CS-38" /LENGTH=509 /DNA_ID=CAMNT_0010486185 /DNA_START=67 /DNA_END=1596 /DNA_ORIENTATION=-
MADMASTVSRGTGTLLSDEELLKVFNQFDYDGSGAIDERELNQAMRMLGVSCTLNTAKKVLHMIDSNSNGLIEWVEFQAFFSRVSDPEDIKDLLSKQCHRFFEYKLAVEQDPGFSKAFNVPPAVHPARRYEGHNESVEKVAWLSDDELISGSIDGDIAVWSLSEVGARARPVKRFQVAGNAALYSMGAIPSMRHLVACLDGRGSSCLRLVSIDDCAEKLSYLGQTTPVYCCGLSEDGTTIASGSKVGCICIHDIERPEPLHKAERAHLNVIHSATFLGSSSTICTASKDGTVKFFDSRSLSAEGRHDQIIEEAATDGAVLEVLGFGDYGVISAGEDYCIKRWDTRQLGIGPVMSYFGHTSAVRTVDAEHTHQVLASGTKSGAVRIWNADEMGSLEVQMAAADQQVAELQSMWPSMEEQFEAGTLDLEELKTTRARIEECKAQSGGLQETIRNLKRRGYQKAILGCDAGKLPVTSLAWRAPSAGGLKLAVGAQDQQVYLFDIDIAGLTAD